MANDNLKYPLNSNLHVARIDFTTIEEKQTTIDELSLTVGSYIRDEIENGDFEGTNPTFNAILNDRIPRQKETCSLYLPQSIQIVDGVSYNNNVQLQILGGALEAAMSGKGASEAFDAAKSQGLGYAGHQVTSFVDAFKAFIGGNGTEVAKRAIISTVARYGNEKYSGAVRSATRVAPNPNARALFESVQLRNFTFSFKLIPSSAEEAVMIKRIVKFFRQELYPNSINVPILDDKSVSVGYEFPNKFDIKMWCTDVDGTDQPVATQIAPCYMTNFVATYNGTSQSFHWDGSFAELDMTMSFTEERALTKQDIEKGF